MRVWFVAGVLGVAYCLSQGANARDLATEPLIGASKRMFPYGQAEAPIGYIDFCNTNPLECLPEGRGLERVELTPDKWRDLVALNKAINQAVKPMSDMALYQVVEHWTYPEPGKGDCEDYVLLKRRKLMEMGWPQSALLITVVRDENGEGHAVLTVRTTRGDYILDNKHSRILSWQRTPYVFIKRQSGKDPRQWVSLIPAEAGPTVASAGVDWKD